ncbi:class I SAM-dependent methyltransferase [Actinomadura rayongensis]|uniref:Methyltransferase domain-containing protein n=1 Tax=Actinomadura rayongensis TaxID=1429076 RepID=A0A6I4WD26_9ACTN|nr:class I SAM-dependent methyltransferase [Actinomadura rayongensis]MXQ68127.1 methyltransferase domain-containing protein [Actinomadura rayongensis]
MLHAEPGASAEEFWEGFYGREDQIFSGNPNGILIREVTALAPGTALDLGCGEGADAIWLARQGWTVTAVDVSATALSRAARDAAAAGVAERIAWRRHDLAVSFPEGTYDLVSAQFLHSPVEMPREEILRRAAAAVAPGGRLLVAGHAGGPSWDTDHDPALHFPTTGEVLAALALPDEDWQVEVDETVVQELTGPDGQPATRPDNILKIRRRRSAR